MSIISNPYSVLMKSERVDGGRKKRGEDGLLIKFRNWEGENLAGSLKHKKIIYYTGTNRLDRFC